MASTALPGGLSAQPPVLPPSIRQAYLPLAIGAGDAARELQQQTGGTVRGDDARLVYRPALLGFASIRFTDRKLGLDESRDATLLLPLEPDAAVLSWKEAVEVDLDPRDLGDNPEQDALFAADLPAGAGDPKALVRMESELADHLYRNQVFTLAYNPTLKLYARPGENERDFRVRCQQAAREQRDAAVDKLESKYSTQLSRVEERLQREQRDLEENKAEYRGRQSEEVLSGLGTVVSVLGIFGRRSRSTSGLSTAATKRRLTSSAKAEIAESEADLARLQAQVDDLKSQMEADANAITSEWAATAEDIQETRAVPRKTDVKVQMVALAWAPTWDLMYQDVRGRERSEAAPAYKVGEKA